MKNNITENMMSYYSRMENIMNDCFLDQIKSIFGISTDDNKVSVPTDSIKGKIKYIVKIKHRMIAKIPISAISKKNNIR